MRQKEEATAKDRHNFEWLQQLRREGFRKVRTHTAASTHGADALRLLQAQISCPTCACLSLHPYYVVRALTDGCGDAIPAVLIPAQSAAPCWACLMEKQTPSSTP